MRRPSLHRLIAELGPHALALVLFVGVVQAGSKW
jgi:hypothetical protein